MNEKKQHDIGRLLAVFTVGVVAVAVAGVAQAMTFDPARSQLAVSLGVLNTPPINAIDAGGGGSVALVDDGVGGHSLVIDASVWATVNYLFGSSLYTGVPILTNIGVTVANGAVTATSSFSAVNYLSQTPGSGHNAIGPRLGGQGGMSGRLFLMVLSGIRLPRALLTSVGGPAGGTSWMTSSGLLYSFTYEPWFTGPVPITGITTNVVSYNGATGAAMTLRLEPGQGKVLSQHGGFVTTNYGPPLEYHTVTPSGANNLLSGASSISGTASVTLVSPMRLNITCPPVPVDHIPGAVWMDLVFVPEPGMLLLLVAGAIGLAVTGRRRVRR